MVYSMSGKMKALFSEATPDAQAKALGPDPKPGDLDWLIKRRQRKEGKIWPDLFYPYDRRYDKPTSI